MKWVVCMIHYCLIFVADGGVLFVGEAKLLNASGFVGSAKSLAVPDPVFGILYWFLMAWTGMAESGTTAFCWFSKIRLHRVYSLFWLTLVLFLYRMMP